MEGIQINTYDTILILGYFLLVLSIGYVLSRRIQTGDDFFLAGNKLGWTAIGFSLFASNISSSSIIGLTGQAYASGISIANYEWMATLVLVFMSLFIIPIYLRNRLSTVPQYLGLRYDSFSRKYYSAVTIILTIIVDLASSLFAGALVINVFFPQLSIAQGCYLLALIAGIYTAAGGLAAVVYTDILQTIILLIGSSIMLFSVLGQHEFSWSQALASVDPEMISLIRPIDDPVLPWLGTLLGVPLLGFYYWSTNQYVVQRILAAKDLENAQWGALLGGALKLLVLFLVVFPGLMALQIFPDLTEQDMVYPTMLMNLIPAGVLGLVLAGLLAAIMSSVDSALNASATLIVLDFIAPSRPDFTEQRLARVGRITTLIVMLVAGFWAPLITNFEGIFNYLQLVLSYSVPPIVTVFLFGIFWPRADALAAKYTLIFGHLACLVALIMQLAGFFTLHFTIVAPLLLLISALIFVTITFQKKSPILDIDLELTWKSGRDVLARASRPWYLQIQYQALILICITFLILLAYW